MQICLSPGRETENLFGVALPEYTTLLFNGLVDAQEMLNCQAGPQAFEGTHI